MKKPKCEHKGMKLKATFARAPEDKFRSVNSMVQGSNPLITKTKPSWSETDFVYSEREVVTTLKSFFIFWNAFP